MARVVRHKHWPESHPFYASAPWHEATKRACDELYRAYIIEQFGPAPARIVPGSPQDRKHRAPGDTWSPPE